MADEKLLDKVQDLSDLELATLLCLTNQQHCIIDTDPEAVDDLVQELRLVRCALFSVAPVANGSQIASNIFGFTHVVLDCNQSTTLDEFTNALFPDTPRSDSPIRVRNDSLLAQSPRFRSQSYSRQLENQRIASVVIARNLSLAPRLVQIQALELIRTKHLFTHSGRYTTPSSFLLIAVLPTNAPRLTEHMNSHVFISHFHDPSSGYPNLEDLDLSDSASISSVVRKPGVLTPSATPLVALQEIAHLQALSKPITITCELTRYLMNVISYLRIHRFVAGGITPLATKHCMQLCKALAPLHGLDFVTPSLVGLAVKKIYAHRIRIVKPEGERSVQWGSRIDDVAEVLDGVTAEGIIEDVLGSVEVPL